MSNSMLREWINLCEMRPMRSKQVSPEEQARRDARRAAEQAVMSRYPSARTEQRGFTTFIMARGADRRDNLLGSGGSDEKAWLDAAERIARDDEEDDLDEAEIVSELLDPESLKVRARLANAIEDARAEFNTARTRENLAAFHAAANALDAFDAEHDKPAPVAASDDDYRGEHQAPTHESGAPLYDLCANGIYPKDFYQGRAHEYGGGEDMRAIGTVLAFHNRPNTSLKIYRTVPQDVKAGINVGDWVAIERRYAVEHGRSHLQGPYRLMSKTVFARDVFTAGDSLQEWGYDPQPRVARTRPAPTSDPE